MSTTKEMLDDAELAKGYITGSGLSDDYKKTYLKLINITTLATNGISPEEKIQKMTEAIQLLAITQGMYMVNIENKINDSIQKANGKQCLNCKAMTHTIEFEQKQEEEKRWRKYLEGMGIDPDNPKGDKDADDKSMTWMDVIKSILTKPYAYVVLGLMSLSPFGVEIIKAILQFYGK